MSEGLQSLQTNFESWMKDVSGRIQNQREDTITEIKDIKSELMDIKKKKMDDLKTEIKTEEMETAELKKRLADLSPSNVPSSSKELYSTNRVLKRSNALDVTKDPDALRLILKEVFNFCVDSAMIQLENLKAILKPSGQNETNMSATRKSQWNVEDLHDQKSRHPDVATLQSTVAKDNLVHITQSFKTSRWTKVCETYKTKHPCLESLQCEKVLAYIDSCLELCWCMCTSNPVLYFIWDGDTSIFTVDDSDGKEGDLKVVHPALVRPHAFGKLENYEVVEKGLKQFKPRQNRNANGGKDSQNLGKEQVKNSVDVKKTEKKNVGGRIADTNSSKYSPTNNLEDPADVVFKTSITIHLPHDATGTTTPATNKHDATGTTTPATNKHDATGTTTPATNKHDATGTTTPATNKHDATGTTTPATNKHDATGTTTPATNKHDATDTTTPATNKHDATGTTTPATDKHDATGTTTSATNKQPQNSKNLTNQQSSVLENLDF